MKNLPLSPQTEINGYLFYTLPYTILYTFPQYKDYLMERYLQCYGYVDERNCMIFGYADGVGYHGDMFYDSGPLDIIFHSYTVGIQLDIQKYIISSIDNNSYVTIFVDEYYIEGRPAYKKERRLHEILIYGYDDENFNYFVFDRKPYFSSFQQNQIDNAYKSGYDIYSIAPIEARVNWVNDKSIILIKPKPIRVPYSFSSRRFIENLKSYLKGEFNALYNSFVFPQEKCYIGVYNTNLVRYCVEKLYPADNVYIIYPSVHAWYESKVNLLNKIKYCYEKIDYESNELILAYEKEIKKQSDVIRLSFFKYDRGGKLNRDIISSSLDNIFISESNIVNSIHDELSSLVMKDI